MSKENNLSTKRAAELMGVSQQFVRVGIQQGLLPFGTALKIHGGRYTYFISKQKFTEHTGIQIPE